MHLLIRQNDKLIGERWLCRIAKKTNLPEGHYLFNEDTGDFSRVDEFEIADSLTKPFKLHVYDNEICVPLDFQQARHYKLNQEIRLQTDEDRCTVIKAYFYSSSLFTKMDSIIGFNTKLYEKLDGNDLRTLTPEEKYFIYFHEQKKEEERRRLEAEKLKTIEGRIKFALETVGATLESHRKSRGKFVVTWKYGKWTINSVVNPDLSIDQLGYCASGYDYTQNLTSAVLLLKSYEEEQYIHITRLV